jgi:hypothetical protein
MGRRKGPVILFEAGKGVRSRKRGQKQEKGSEPILFGPVVAEGVMIGNRVREAGG